MEVLAEKVDDIKQRVADNTNKSNTTPQKHPNASAKPTDEQQVSPVYATANRELDLTGSWVFSSECAPHRGLFDLKKSGRNGY
jgi:hypothetical protein